MTDNFRARLKNPTGWFAAGREVMRASGVLSDGAFKLYLYLCLNADRSTGRLQACHGDLAKAVKKSRRSVVTYLEELRRLGVCALQSAINQHTAGEIEICDVFWPYERIPSMKIANEQVSYTEQVRRLFHAHRCVEGSFSAADQKLAGTLFHQGVSLKQVELALLLGCARKYISMLNGKSSGSIISLSYFQQVVDEIKEHHISSEYGNYLRSRVRHLEQQWLSRNTRS